MSAVSFERRMPSHVLRERLRVHTSPVYRHSRSWLQRLQNSIFACKKNCYSVTLWTGQQQSESPHLSTSGDSRAKCSDVGTVYCRSLESVSRKSGSAFAYAVQSTTSDQLLVIDQGGDEHSDQTADDRSESVISSSFNTATGCNLPSLAVCNCTNSFVGPNAQEIVHFGCPSFQTFFSLNLLVQESIQMTN